MKNEEKFFIYANEASELKLQKRIGAYCERGLAGERLMKLWLQSSQNNAEGKRKRHFMKNDFNLQFINTRLKHLADAE